MILLDQNAAGGEQHPFDLSDRGLLLGDGVFDTSLVTGGAMMLREAHLDRLCRDADALEINVDRTILKNTADQILQNKPSGALRLTITRGPGGRGLSGGDDTEPTVIARLSDYDTSRIGKPAALLISDLTRNPGSISARHKTLSYTDNVLAVRRAARSGADDAVMLNPFGKVACAASANIFARIGETLLTPPVEDGALPGIIRQFVLDEASTAGFKAVQQSLSPADLKKADQIFITNSLRLIAPVSRFDGVEFDPAPLTALNTRLRNVRGGPQ